MKTALILGGAAIAIYVVWKFGTAAAGPPLSVSSAPLSATGNGPYPPAPTLPAVSSLPMPINPATGQTFTKAQYAALTTEQRAAVMRPYVVRAQARGAGKEDPVSTAAAHTQPTSSGVAVSTGGLPPAIPGGGYRV